ncbi:MAG: glycosyltransferase family 4 protein [Solirubrobacterales bacterium]
MATIGQRGGEASGERPLEVALLSPCYWPEVRRGGERLTRVLADGLLARGQRPSLITSHRGPPSRAVEDGMEVLRLPRPPHRWLARLGFEDYRSHVPLVYAALRAGSADVAHAMFPTDALAAVRWAARTRRPAIHTYLGVPDPGWLRSRRLRRRTLGRVVREADAVVAISRYAAAAFRESFGYEAPVITPGVDLGVFRPSGARAPSPTVLCTAAADEPRKHVGLLVEAFAKVRRERPEARLLLSRPRDPAAARAAGVDPGAAGVEWADLDSADAIVRAYSEAWVTVLAAPNEAFGLVLAESMACGTPVAGLARAGIPEVVDREEVGRLFEPLEAGPLAQAILAAMELATDPGTAAACRARAEELSADRSAELYLRLYRDSLARRARRAAG